MKITSYWKPILAGLALFIVAIYLPGKWVMKGLDMNLDMDFEAVSILDGMTVDGYTFDDLLDAIEWVESEGNGDAVGDNGDAIGAYQIHKAYVDDVNSYICQQRLKLATFRYDDRWDKQKSRQMMELYLEKYCGVWLDWSKFEKMARVHNGGPNGWLKDSTKPYWEKVKAIMERGEE